MSNASAPCCKRAIQPFVKQEERLEQYTRECFDRMASQQSNSAAASTADNCQMHQISLCNDRLQQMLGGTAPSCAQAAPCAVFRSQEPEFRSARAPIRAQANLNWLNTSAHRYIVAE